MTGFRLGMTVDWAILTAVNKDFAYFPYINLNKSSLFNGLASAKKKILTSDKWDGYRGWLTVCRIAYGTPLDDGFFGTWAMLSG